MAIEAYSKEAIRVQTLNRERALIEEAIGLMKSYHQMTQKDPQNCYSDNLVMARDLLDSIKCNMINCKAGFKFIWNGKNWEIKGLGEDG